MKMSYFYFVSAIIMIILIFCSNRAETRPDDSPSPYGPLEKMFTSGGKSPLVAATYYFNPGSPFVGRSDPNVVPEELKDESNEIGSSSSEGSDGCFAPDGRRGSCYEAKECVARGGTPMGSCSSSSSSPLSSSSSHSSSGSGSVSTGKTSSPGSVCCLFEITCGDFAAEKYIYFRNPSFPQTYSQPRMCRVRVGKKSKNICQYRVDLINFDLAPPNQGNCSQDIFVVSGQNENNVVPKICGVNSGHHYYFGVDESGVVTLHMMMLGYYERKFDILVSQISCQSEQKAPAHCLQYFSGTHGRIKSFNYDLISPGNTSQEGYPNDIDYIICIRKEPGFCSITYELATVESQIRPFSVGSPLKSAIRSNPPIAAQCKEDYLVVGGVRLCSASVPGDSLAQVADVSLSGVRKSEIQAGTLLNATFNSPSLVTDITPGPFILRFVSSAAENSRGFALNFRQNPCK